jgi:thiamine monophosphate kinase
VDDAPAGAPVATVDNAALLAIALPIASAFANLPTGFNHLKEAYNVNYIAGNISC